MVGVIAMKVRRLFPMLAALELCLCVRAQGVVGKDVREPWLILGWRRGRVMEFLEHGVVNQSRTIHG